MQFAVNAALFNPNIEIAFPAKLENAGSEIADARL
jgi:hypothetical protein